MAKTAVITLQAVWDCDWARLAYPVNRASDQWVCVRDGAHRPTTEQECETCHFWEAKGETLDTVTAVEDTEIRFAPSGSATVKALRTVLLFNALVLFASGFVILTRPLHIPLTVALWLCAAALIGAAAFAPFESGGAPALREGR